MKFEQKKIFNQKVLKFGKLYTEKTILSNQQKYFVGIYATKFFCCSKKNILLYQSSFGYLNKMFCQDNKKRFCCINFFLRVNLKDREISPFMASIHSLNIDILIKDKASSWNNANNKK